ncbi:MAG: protease complex subunit PrcB family protein [Gorillibacterium sp.]|nr:protease complex subunit PrcB family protein [Gorillibacterium sp.]
MKRKSMLILLLTSMLVLAFGSSVWGFSDSSRHQNNDKINALQESGVLFGEPGGKFNAEGKLTYAAGVSMIVKGLNLNLDNIRFIKAPMASDYFTYVKDNAWYSEAFIIAQVKGLELPRDVKPGEAMTREAFAHYLFRAIEANGPHAYIMLFTEIKDEASINPAFSGSIQNLLHSNVIELDANQYFAPKAKISRGVAADWLYNAIQFVKNTPIPDQGMDNPLMDTTITSQAVNPDVNKVTITAQAPHPGYGFRVDKVIYANGQAVIYLETILPDPDKMYIQVITEIKVVTYIGSEFKPVLADTTSVVPFPEVTSMPTTGPATK